MSDASGKWVKPFDDDWVAYYEPPRDAESEAVEATIDAGLTAFATHKQYLLAALRNAYERKGPKSEPFDADKAWSLLTFLAATYFWESRVKQGRVPAAERRRRLRAFKRAMGKARAMADQAMQDDVGNDLYSAWLKASVRYDLDPDDLKPPFTLVCLEDEFEKVLANLATLEAVASCAVDDVPAGLSGKPPLLPTGYIRTLADIFRKSTGHEPGTGHGFFTRFVMLFRASLDPSYKTADEAGFECVDESMVDAIKLALGKRRKRPPRTKQPKRRRLIPYSGQRT